MKKKLINPVNPKKKHLPLLKALLEQTSDNTQGWHESNYYQITYKKKKIKVALTNTVIKRESKKGENRYEAIDSTPLGKGAYGIVYPVQVTMKFAEKELIIKEKPFGKRRIVKQRPYNTKTMDDAVNEYTLTRMTPHSHPKIPVRFGAHIYSISRRMEGRELFDIINDDLTGARKLTIAERFMLSKHLIEALQTQVFAADLVHRDLKPENIMVELSEGLIGTIDFGLAKINNTYVDNDAVGSPLYVSPEVLLGRGTTQQSDIYSLGRILALLWHTDLASYDTRLNGKQLLKVARNNDYSHLFHNITELDEKAALTIKRIIEGMTAYAPAARMSLEKALIKFNKAENLQFPDIKQKASPSDMTRTAITKTPNLLGAHLKEEEPQEKEPLLEKPKQKKWGWFFKTSKEEPTITPQKEQQSTSKNERY
ncbi:protein kinase domain-containing protein [Legionella clemsonensis]|uniref:Serine/threonine-protein kinase Pkn1 n=1 Tax=Legionella clemsonensis TaxID=1867846 RepID=A0A222P6L0_9GAMM|nr:protein kinase [Legionella clemsonensis]ASQ47486.1 Serine/threonine-protein kinase Pkn1 [Legionella clemsonensis]